MIRTRFMLETGLAVLSGFVTVLTLLAHNWLEVLGVDPDHGSGSAEWAIVIASASVCIAVTLDARRVRGRLRLASSDS
jgi:hypothetical protein